MPVDLLVFGPHPDDIEIGLGATVAAHSDAGYAVGLVDLTRGELSSNGTPGQRRLEADAAARVLGAAWRENLEWPDGGIARTSSQIRTAVDVIRRHRPRAVALPYWDDRHPDHRAASDVLSVAVFTGALRRYESDEAPWQPDWVCYYFINDAGAPSFLVDASAHYARKRQALACYASQFAPRERDAVPTRLTADTFQQLIESRDAQFGALAGVRFAEGVIVKEPLVRATLLKHVP